jgi:hypothetical protein
MSRAKKETFYFFVLLEENKKEHFLGNTLFYFKYDY